MKTRAARAISLVLTITLASLALARNVAAQNAQGAPAGAWPTYGGDLGSTRYAALEQIDASNFGSLEVAWRFNTANLGPTPEYRFQSTPLVVDGVLYTTAGSRRAVTALDAATGEQLWVYSLNEGERGADAPRRLSGRGLAFWQKGADKRVLYVTPGYRLVADGRTNRQIAEELFISPKTASVHVSNILRKLDLRSRVEASAFAYRLGLLDGPGA